MGKMLEILRQSEKTQYNGWGLLDPLSEPVPVKMPSSEQLKTNEIGILRKSVAFLKKENRRLRIELLDMMKEADSEVPTGDGIDRMEKLLCEFYNIPVSSLSNPRRNYPEAQAKHIIRFCMDKTFGLPKTIIGKRYKRAHSSVIASIHYIEQLYESGQMPLDILLLINKLCGKTIFEVK